MTRALITNVGRRGIDIVVAGDAEGGVPPTVFLSPGESRELDVNVDSGWIKGMIVGGAISVKATTKPAAPAKTPLPPPLNEGTDK